MSETWAVAKITPEALSLEQLKDDWDKCNEVVEAERLRRITWVWNGFKYVHIDDFLRVMAT